MKRLVLCLSVVLCCSPGNAADDLQDKPFQGSRLVEIIPDFPRSVLSCEGQTRNDVYKRYYSDGALYQEAHCQNEMLEGRMRQYHPDGTLAVNAYYYHDQLEGTFEKYYKDGTLWEKRKYKSGKQNGISREFYSSGNLKMEDRYVNGAREGRRLVYHENGMLLSEERYVKGKPQDNPVEYDQQGNFVPSIEGYGRFSKRNDDMAEDLPSGGNAILLSPRTVPSHVNQREETSEFWP